LLVVKDFTSVVDRVQAKVRPEWGRVIVLGIASVPLFIIVVLLVAVTFLAFQDTTSVAGYSSVVLTLRNFRDLFLSPFVYESFLNTIGFTLVTVLVALAFGVPCAWLVERTDLPGRSFIFPLMTTTLLVPSFLTAMGWLFLFHRRIGLANKWLMQTLSIDYAPFNISTVIGMGWVQGLSLAPLAFVMVASSLQAFDPVLEQSAQIHGMGPIDRLRKITIPLLRPSLLATAIYVGAIGLAAFDVPAVIGLGSRVFTLSTFVYTKALPYDGVPNYGIVGAASAILLVIGVFVSLSYFKVVAKANHYAVVTGRNYRPQLTELGTWSTVAGWAVIITVIGLTVILPLLALIWAAFSPFVAVPSRAAIGRLSLENFRQISWETLWFTGRNSLILVVTVPTLTTICSLAISWIVVRSRMGMAALFDVLAFIPHVIPNLLFAVGAIALGLFVLGDALPIYGTIYIIMIVYVATKLSFATRIFNSALVQIHTELDDAGYVFGLGVTSVLWNILRPLLTSAILYAWLWIAMLTLRELTMASLLAAKDNITLPVYVWALWQNNSFNLAAAVALIVFLAMLPVVAVYLTVSRRQLARDVLTP
jgi:iron(III) transport system permease protein